MSKNWKEILESLEEADASIDSNLEDPIEGSAPASDTGSSNSDDDLLDQLNKIFTPVLVMQGIEGDIKDQVTEAMDVASVLTEKNIIKFDNATRMAQLISVCALLIAKNNQSTDYQTYEKAAIIKNKMKLKIQKDNYDAAKALAQKYLVNVSTTNASSVAREMANKLLPETNH